MLSVSIIPSHPALSEFIVNYSLCRSKSYIKGVDLPWVAHHDTSLCFFLADRPVQKPNRDTPNSNRRIDEITLFGLLTQCRDAMIFEGNYNTFMIEFRPNGFTRLFEIPASEICDNFFSADEVIGTVVEELHTQLLDAQNIREMVGYTDNFLLGFLNKRRVAYYNDGITRISSQLLLNSFPNISQYASQANMSLRNFERRFTEQVGTSPKLFCRLTRFNNAVQSKIADPEKSWSDTAFDCGYYDDMHLIKEFKQFTNASPTVFFEKNPFLTEESFQIIER